MLHHLAEQLKELLHQVTYLRAKPSLAITGRFLNATHSAIAKSWGLATKVYLVVLHALARKITKINLSTLLLAPTPILLSASQIAKI